MMKFLSLLFCFISSSIFSQNTKPWNGKKAAVVITYDDALNQQLDNAIPVLDSLKLKATFYLTAFSDGCKNRINDWRKAAKNGHELANHTLFHPCMGNAPGREWVKGEQLMNNYTITRMENEIQMTNVFLNSLDGKTKRTFAFTCGDMKIGDSSFINGMKNDFLAARAVRNEMHTIDSIDLYNVDCFMVNNHTADQMIEWVKKAKETNSLLVILFHGVGGGNGLDVKLSEHRKFLNFIKKNEKDLWIAPMLEVAEYVKKYKGKKSNKL